MRHEPRNKNCYVYGPNAVSVIVPQNWFKSFQSSNFYVKDEPLCGRAVTDKVDAILEKRSCTVGTAMLFSDIDPVLYCNGHRYLTPVNDYHHWAGGPTVVRAADTYVT
ncbi:hypothetical protein EVAR_6580_1 [Eumeta japonica]|uniref:Uncharacterized protein n=1 Tax=Eumeta variegata TaxID=151549 RepID=A0A4C1ST15_EUMVA|nr:hypothetical protein EVAR_6580_1 [Eumeta japonica]